jgi:hypothetical protein
VIRRQRAVWHSNSDQVFVMILQLEMQHSRMNVETSS